MEDEKWFKGLGEGTRSAHRPTEKENNTLPSLRSLSKHWNSGGVKLASGGREGFGELGQSFAGPLSLGLMVSGQSPYPRNQRENNHGPKVAQSQCEGILFSAKSHCHVSN
jgi:hypothetical protein